MKKRGLVAVTVTLVVLCLAVFCSPVIAKEFVLGTFGDVDHPLVKIRVAFMQECFKANGYDLTVKYMPALRSLEAANKGETDGDLFRAFDLNAKNEFPGLVRVDYPVSYYPMYAFVTNPNIKINEARDLSAYRVVTLRGDRVLEAKINPLIPKDKLFIVDSYEQGFKMLAAGRTDIVITDRSRAAGHIKAAGLEGKVTMLEKPVVLVNLYTYFNKKNAVLAGKMAETIKAKMVDGTYKKIVGITTPQP